MIEMSVSNGQNIYISRLLRLELEYCVQSKTLDPRNSNLVIVAIA